MRCRVCCLFAVSLSLTALGCRGANQQVAQTPVIPPPGAKIIKADQAYNGPKKDPSPTLCVNAGKLLEDSAKMEQNTPERRRGQLERARRAYDQALQQEPKNRDAMLGLAMVYDKQGRVDQAVETYQRGIKQFPKDADFHFEFGRCWSRQRKWDRSIESLKKAVELAPDKTAYSNVLGHTLAWAEKYQESFDHFKRTQGEATAYYNLAYVLGCQGHTTECRQYAEAALLVNPNMTDAQSLLAELSGSTDAATQARQ